MCIIMLSNLWVVNTKDIIDEQKSSNFARKELCIISFCKKISISTTKLDTSNYVRNLRYIFHLNPMDLFIEDRNH